MKKKVVKKASLHRHAQKTSRVKRGLWHQSPFKISIFSAAILGCLTLFAVSYHMTNGTDVLGANTISNYYMQPNKCATPPLGTTAAGHISGHTYLIYESGTKAKPIYNCVADCTAGTGTTTHCPPGLLRKVVTSTKSVTPTLKRAISVSIVYGETCNADKSVNVYVSWQAQNYTNKNGFLVTLVNPVKNNALVASKTEPSGTKLATFTVPASTIGYTLVAAVRDAGVALAGNTPSTSFNCNSK